MPFLPPNQQRQSTEGLIVTTRINSAYAFVTQWKIIIRHASFYLFYFISDVQTSACLGIKGGGNGLQPAIPGSATTCIYNKYQL